MKKWKILKTKKIFSHPRLTLLEDEVELPNGLRTKYLKFAEDGNAVTIICKRDDGKILLAKEYTHPSQKWIYQFPGGHVPREEDLRSGAIRELMEEAKLSAKNLDLLGNYLINNRRSTAKMYVYLAINLKDDALDGDPEEDIRNFWFSEDEVDRLISDGKIVNCHILASWLFYKLKKSKKCA